MPTHGSQEDVPASGSSPQGSSKASPGSSMVPVKGSSKVSQHGSSMVPASFQRKGPASGFSGCAFSCHHSPAPEIGTEQIRC